MIGMGNLEVIHTGTLILYDWDISGSSIFIVDILRIDDLRIDDQILVVEKQIKRKEAVKSSFLGCSHHRCSIKFSNV